MLTNVGLNNVKESHQMFASTRVHLFSSILKVFFFFIIAFFSGSHLSENCIQVTSQEFQDLLSLANNWNIQQMRWISFSEVPYCSASFLCHTQSICCMKSEEIQRRTDNATRCSRKISTVLTEIQYNLLFKNDSLPLHTVLRTEGADLGLCFQNWMLEGVSHLLESIHMCLRECCGNTGYYF